MKITKTDRQNLNAGLIEKGLDGNGRFTSFGDGVAAINEALDSSRLFVGLVNGLDVERNGAGSVTKVLDVENLDGETVENSMLVTSWYYITESDRYECVAYMS